MRGKIKVSIDRERCKGCGYCCKACPKQLIVVSRNINAKGYNCAVIKNMNECSGCRFCALVCPETAIEIEMVPLRKKARV